MMNDVRLGAIRMSNFTLEKIRKAPALYPLTAGYASAVVIIMLVASGTVKGNVGIGILGFGTIIILLISMQYAIHKLSHLPKEIQEVHHLVNSQTDSLVARIDQLILVLQEAGIQVPPAAKGKTPS
jgi:hypothetical protein